ncbi:hypothetical protein FRX31_010426 [Thalictrum thalictroides]|uniref:Uncharacterized protein n=1 Tax=Thalictrum thalictroides TaxID=46969 RepID=A0A7J6WT59_THATH|nr:hypothetical protein FRX31_010426 [Thalictrum thalictroides]
MTKKGGIPQSSVGQDQLVYMGKRVCCSCRKGSWDPLVWEAGNPRLLPNSYGRTIANVPTQERYHF